MYTCNHCKQQKERRDVYPTGYKYWRCKDCDRYFAQKYKARRAERARTSQRWRNLKFKYGVSKEEYQRLLELQGGACAICKTTTEGFNLAVDHNHASGKVRGLLCQTCNRGVGLLGDTPERLKAVLNYLMETH